MMPLPSGGRRACPTRSYACVASRAPLRRSARRARPPRAVRALGFDVVEMNASDTRSKKLLGQNVADILDTASVGSLMGKGNQNNSVTIKVC